MVSSVPSTQPRLYYCTVCKAKLSKPRAICAECQSKLPSRDRFHEQRVRGQFGEESPVPGLEERLVRLVAAADVAMDRISHGLHPEPLLPYPRDDSIDE